MFLTAVIVTVRIVMRLMTLTAVSIIMIITIVSGSGHEGVGPSKHLPALRGLRGQETHAPDLADGGLGAKRRAELLRDGPISLLRQQLHQSGALPANRAGPASHAVEALLRLTCLPYGRAPDHGSRKLHPASRGLLILWLERQESAAQFLTDISL